VCLRYIRALLHNVPMLAGLIISSRKDAIDLANGISVEVSTASSRTIRGYTVVGCVLDEVAFWRTDEDAAEPDSEIIAALRPAMATVPNAMLLALSSPYSRRGELWTNYQRHFGKDGDVLVWKAATRTMNPAVSESVIADAYARDEASASAEYGAEFRRDIETFIDREVLQAVIVQSRLSLPPVSGVPYVAFADPAGGSGGDSFTLALSHIDRAGRVVLDFLGEKRSPFSPEVAIAEFASVLRSFRVSHVTSDRYAGDFPVDAWRRHGIRCEPSERSKSEIYRDLLPILNSGQVELLDHARLIGQLTGLERRTARGGRDSIDHSPGAHDDLANAAAGALVLAAMPRTAAVTPFKLKGL